MGVRARMTMRATIERNETPGVDDYGQPGPPGWVIIGVDVPCYAWQGSGTGRQTVVGNQRTVTVDMPGMVVPLDTDITESDRIRSVTDRRGRELFGMMYIDSVLRRKDHLAVRLRTHG